MSPVLQRNVALTVALAAASFPAACGHSNGPDIIPVDYTDFSHDRGPLMAIIGRHASELTVEQDLDITNYVLAAADVGDSFFLQLSNVPLRHINDEKIFLATEEVAAMQHRLADDPGNPAAVGEPPLGQFDFYISVPLESNFVATANMVGSFVVMITAWEDPNARGVALDIESEVRFVMGDQLYAHAASIPW
ncbi:hypothetical protein OAO01_01965 [Oligoflexia bacterium]|nr:hypothetical protein [Oligoflexia bacterium]